MAFPPPGFACEREGGSEGGLYARALLDEEGCVRESRRHTTSEQSRRTARPPAKLCSIRDSQLRRSDSHGPPLRASMVTCLVGWIACTYVRFRLSFVSDFGYA